MSSGTGWLMISLKKSSPSLDFTLPQHRLVGLALVPPELRAVGDSELTACFALFILVVQADGATEEPLHLVAEAGAGPPGSRRCRC